MKFVRTDALGLAIPPSNLSCVGPEYCPLIDTPRGCYPSGHHIYFEEDYYREHSELAWEFRNDPNNKIDMARCQELRIHDRFDGTRVPTAFIMELFLEESAILQDLGALSRRVLSADKALVQHVRMAEKVEAHAKKTGNDTHGYWYREKIERTEVFKNTFERRRNNELLTSVGFVAISPALMKAKGYDRIIPELFEAA